MFNTKKTIRRNVHGNEAAYSGTVTVVTHKTIVVFIPALDVDVDVRPSQYIRPERLHPHRGFRQLGYRLSY